MFVTSAEQRGGVLVAVITGGRPKLAQRHTRRHLPELKKAGFTNICWVVAEHDAPQYERDEYDLAIYPTQWAHDYAAAHWMSTDPVPPPGGFVGAFAGREWACLEAERRGCWAVLQLDDNIASLSVARGSKAGCEVVRNNGGLALYADLLAATTAATNGRMVGAQLCAVPEVRIQTARPGFPYSLFIEQVGQGREHWYGPFEDDITHAFQYGTRYDGATAAIMPLIQYQKEHKSKSGMRGKYNHKRALQLQRIFPQSAKINVRKTHSNGRGQPRIFHTMTAGSIRNPLVVKNKALYRRVNDRLAGVMEEWAGLNQHYNQQKIRARAGLPTTT